MSAVKTISHNNAGRLLPAGVRLPFLKKKCTTEVSGQSSQANSVSRHSAIRLRFAHCTNARPAYSLQTVRKSNSFCKLLRHQIMTKTREPYRHTPIGERLGGVSAQPIDARFDAKKHETACQPTATEVFLHFAPSRVT